MRKEMLVMVSNSTSIMTFKLAARYPNRIGLMIPTNGWRDPWPLPFAIDNGAYSAFRNNKRWNEKPFLNLLTKVSVWRQKHLRDYSPLFITIPDVVENANDTLRLWREWAEKLQAYGWPLALVIQDGMAVSDLPRKPRPDTIFIGGSLQWKIRQIESGRWLSKTKHLHAGRIFTWEHLQLCDESGVNSCDSTAFFRRGSKLQDNKRLRELVEYLEGKKWPQKILF